ncbi:MAG: retropepsin-like aspartic protease [Pseudomonadota bacterium]
MNSTPMKAIVLFALSFISVKGALSGVLDTKVPLIDKGISTFYVEGQIGGAGVVDLLIDTGAGYTAINEKTLKTLKKKGLANHLRDITARLANGDSVVVPIYRIEKLNIGGSCEVRNVEVAVLPGDSRCILGLNTLKKVAPFMVSIDPPSLSLSHCRKALNQNTLGAIR